MLQRGHEREPDRLARHGHVGRVALAGDGALRHRLDPGHLGQGVQVRDDGLARRAEIHRPRAPLAPVQHVQADVGGDAVEPRAQRGTALEAVDAAPRAQERVLHGVLGLEGRAQHPVAVRGQLAAMLLELTERGRERHRTLHKGHPRRSCSRPPPPSGAMTAPRLETQRCAVYVSGRVSNVTRMRVILPFSTRLQFATGAGGATVVCRSNHVSTSPPSTNRLTMTMSVVISARCSMPSRHSRRPRRRRAARRS